MVSVRAIAVAAMMTASVVAHAQTADQLQAEGEQAAKQGSYAEAIQKFKAADRIEPRASHACLIALAYTRRNLWPQAEIFRDRCHALAKERNEPLPDWIDTADSQIATAIAKAVQEGSVAEVTIMVEPADAAALVTVSSFAPDETFAPRAIHLATGIHQIFANAAGYETGTQLLDIADSRPKTVVIKLHRPGEVPAAAARPPAGPPASKVPWIVMGTGVGIAAIGGVIDATIYRDARNDYAHHYSDPAKESTWETERDVLYGVYTAGAIAFGIGVALKYTKYKKPEHAPTITFVPRGDGGMVSLGWSR
jgi:tetratricopeptide (TPR) repeat protein